MFPMLESRENKEYKLMYNAVGTKGRGNETNVSLCA